MGTASIINTDELLLEANGFGRSAGIYTLQAAPANALRMKIAFRWGRPGMTATVFENEPSLIWNPYSCIGLNFINEIPADADDEIPVYQTGAAFDGFIGWFEIFNDLIGHEMRRTDHLGESFVTNIGQSASWADYISWGVPQATKARQLFSASGAVPSGGRWLSCPISTTVDKWTTSIDIWGSSLDKTVYCQFKGNGATLAEGSFLDAIDDAAFNGEHNSGIQTIHGDATSNWRNANGTMNFPRYFVARNGSKDVDLNVLRIEYEYLTETPS